MKKGLGVWVMAGLAATVVFSIAPAWGAEVDVGKVVVTATKTEMEISESPQSISVITKEEIQNSPDRTIGEILQRAPRDRADIAVVEIEPSQARNKSLNTYNDLFRDRRPSAYRLES